MEFIQKYVLLSKRKMKENWYRFEDAVYANQKKTLIYVFSGILAAFCLAGLIFVSQARIRESLVENMAFRQLPSEKVLPLGYREADKLIADTKAISVMFSRPNGGELQETFELLGEKDGELNRSFYYYPIVYDSQGFKDEYQVEPDEITFVFYEAGVEKNRFTLSSLEDPESELIPEINRLPMWNIKNISE